MYIPVAANMVAAVVESLKGEVEDIPRVAQEIEKIAPKIETPQGGPLIFDQYHQRIINMYVLKVEKKDGKLVNAVIANLGKVPQEDVWKWWRK